MFEQPGKRREVSRRDSLSSTLESDATTVNNSQKGTALTTVDCDGRTLGTGQRDNTPQDNESLDIMNTPHVSAPVGTSPNGMPPNEVAHHVHGISTSIDNSQTRSQTSNLILALRRPLSQRWL